MDCTDTRDRKHLYKHILGLLLFRKEANCMCKENVYVLC